MVGQGQLSRCILSVAHLSCLCLGHKGTSITDLWVIFYMHGRDQIWNSVGFLHRQCQHTWHNVIRTSSSKRTAARPRLFTEPQSVVTRSEIVPFLMISLHFVLEILRSSTWQFFFLKSKLPFLMLSLKAGAVSYLLQSLWAQWSFLQSS